VWVCSSGLFKTLSIHTPKSPKKPFSTTNGGAMMSTAKALKAPQHAIGFRNIGLVSIDEIQSGRSF